jgi:hypothetical protein
MTRRPRQAKAARKISRKISSKTSRKISRESRMAMRRAKPERRDPLDDFIAAGSRALDLKIDKAWMPAVRSHLEVTLRLGALVTGFVLPDDAEPAPVFRA